VIEVLLWISAALWTVFLLQLCVSMLIAPDLEAIEIGDDTDWPSVSIVVPARNEEGGIRAAVTSFCKQDYSSLEVIVVDDGSTDRTPQILAERAPRQVGTRPSVKWTLGRLGEIADGWG
jgi:cellulose synthase/poly-beta-1,6-N-acetylglucosamine synthase-like glycosyltransferase